MRTRRWADRVPSSDPPDLGLHGVGVDLDEDQIRTAHTASEGLPDVRFQVADATALPFEDDAFDLVYTNKTTHHIRDWRGALAEMARVLKPGGHLVNSDFAARLPTSSGIDTTAADYGLKQLHRSRTLFLYTTTFTKPAAR